MIMNSNPICPECGREVKNFYDIDYALIPHPFSSDPENKVCIYCAVRIQYTAIEREKREHNEHICALLDQNLSGLFQTLLTDSEFRNIFKMHLRHFGAFGNKVDSVTSYSLFSRSVEKLMCEHILPKNAMGSYLSMSEEEFNTVKQVVTDYTLSLLVSASDRIVQTAIRINNGLSDSYNLDFISNRKYGRLMIKAYRDKALTLPITKQEQAFFDEVINDCCNILDEEAGKEQPGFSKFLQSSAPGKTNVMDFLRYYKNGSSDLKLWLFSSDDGSQIAAVAFPDDSASQVDFYDWFNTSRSENFSEPRYIFSKEVIDRINIPSDQTTAEMKQAALQTVLENLKEQDAPLRDKYRSQLEELERTFPVSEPWNHLIKEMNESEDQEIIKDDLAYEEAINGDGELKYRYIRRHYTEVKNSAFDCIYDENLTMLDKDRLLTRYVELQKMIWHDQYLLPKGIIDLKLYQDVGAFKNTFDGTDIKSLVIYFHHWRVSKDEKSLIMVLEMIYNLLETKLLFDFEQYVSVVPYKSSVPVFSDRLPFLVLISRCCELLDRYLAEVIPVIDRVGEDDLNHLKCAKIDSLYDMPSQNFTTHMNISEREYLDRSLSKLSFEEMRHASLSNMELSPEIRAIVDGKLLERAIKALQNRMDTIVANIAVNHIGETLDAVSLLIDLITVLPENTDRLNKEEEQQLLRLRGRLRKQLMRMEETAFLEPEIYEEHIRSNSIHFIKVREDLTARFRSQFKYFIGSLDLIGAKNIEELMEQRRRFVLEFSLDPEMHNNMNVFLDRLTMKISESLKDSESYRSRRQQIQHQLSSYPLDIHESVVSTLATAEELYYTYIDGREPIEGFDYSCISIMYFQALENLLNRVIYIPYKTSVLDPNLTDIYLNFNANQYLPKASSMSFYFSTYKTVNSCRLKDDMTLGSFPFLFKNVMTLRAFEAFLQKTFHTRRLDLTELNSFGDNLRIIALRRNSAAHGSKVLDSETVVQDRDLVYHENKAASAQIKAAILQFLSMFN